MKKVMKSMKVKGKNHAKGKALTKGPRKGQLPTQVAMVNPCPWKRKWSISTKKDGCVQTFLDKLTSGQRECLWGKFKRAREAFRDLEEKWNTHCKGNGSDPKKKALLKVFLQNEGNLKKNDHFMKEMVRLTEVRGKKEKEQWAPFATILHSFGLNEAMRRAPWFSR